MLAQGRSNALGIYARVAGFLLLIGAAVFAGLWLGEKSVRFEEDRPVPHAAAETPKLKADTPPLPPPPMYCYVTIPSGAGQDVVLEEISMAAKSGIHQYVLNVPLPWEGDASAFLDPIGLLQRTDPQAGILLSIRMDPPPAWISSHPDEVVKAAATESSLVSLASDAWRRDANVALEALITGVKASQEPKHILGFVLGGLEDGRWGHGSAYDTSPANIAGFREWLQAFYKEPGALQQAWGDANATFDSAVIPDAAEAPTPCPLFWDGAGMQARADFLRFTSEATANIIAGFAAHIKKLAGSEAKVFASYGYTFEESDGASGHFALDKLLQSEVDGFVSPVSYVDRGLGGAGGLMGPADSAVLRGKQWILLDDTRTGLVRDPATGEVARPKNLRAEDVYTVQQRNFTMALTHGFGLMWADPDGDGWLHDTDMWPRLYKMWSIYQNVAAQHSPSTFLGPLMAVVVDEMSRFYMHGAAENVELLLGQVRDSASRAAMTTRYYLLSDVLEQRAPAASVYLFLNAYKLSAEARSHLHQILEQNKAAAIWLYAPGYIDEAPSVENISATTRMRVAMFDGPTRSGSTAVLPGRWINKNESFGADMDWSPLFYIDDNEADTIAKYRVSGKPSICARFFQEGWSSIFCAEPGLSGAMLREILGILEVHLFMQPTSSRFVDAMQAGPNLLAIHAKEAGERVLELERTYDIQDLLSPDIGWPRKRSVTIPLKTGDTRLLQLTPVEETEDNTAKEPATP